MASHRNFEEKVEAVIISRSERERQQRRMMRGEAFIVTFSFIIAGLYVLGIIGPY